MTFNLDRRWGRKDATLDVIGVVWFQQGHVEDWMGSRHLVTEIKAVGARVDGLNDGIGAKAHYIEFIGRANGLDVLSKEPDLVAGLEVRLGLAVLIIITFL